MSDKRAEKIEHNKEVYAKLSSAAPGILGDGYVEHHVERSTG